MATTGRSEEGDHPQPMEQRGEFTVLERKVMHDRFGMQLIGDRIMTSDGQEGEQFWINFPRQAVLVFPLDREGNIYLNREYTYATAECKLEAAGGTPEADETFEAAALREVREELGIEVDELRKINIYQSITSRVNNTTHVYLARVATVGEATPATGEYTRLEKMPFLEALELVRNGVINTADVAAAIWHINDILSAEEKVET